MSATIGQIIENRIEQMKQQKAGHEAEIIILDSSINALQAKLDEVNKKNEKSK